MGLHRFEIYNSTQKLKNALKQTSYLSKYSSGLKNLTSSSFLKAFGQVQNITSEIFIHEILRSSDRTVIKLNKYFRST
jgi:hypothetical protein